MKKITTDTPEEYIGLHLSKRISKIRADAEVRSFVDLLFKTKTFEDIAVACNRQFGRPRAPSKSAIGRYWLERVQADSPDSDRDPRGRKRRT